MEEKNKKGLYIILIFLFICIVGFIIFYIIKNKNVDSNGKYEDDSSYKYKLMVCKSKDTSSYSKVKSSSECDGELIIIKTNSPVVNLSDHSLENYIIYTDNDTIKIYDYNNKKSISLGISKDNYIPVDLFISNGELKGVVLSRKYDGVSYSEFYSVKAGKVLYEHKYISDKFAIFGLIKNYLVMNYYDEEKSLYKSLLLNSDREETLLEIEDSSTVSRPAFFELLDNSFIEIDYFIDNKFNSKVYTLDLKEISSNSDYYSVTSNKELLSLKNNVVSVFDEKGNLIKNIDGYKKIYTVASDYLVTSVDDKITLINSKDEKIDLNIPFMSNDFFVGANYDKTTNTISVKVGPSNVDFEEYYKEYAKNGDMIYTKDELKKCKYDYEYIYNFNTKELVKKVYPYC